MSADFIDLIKRAARVLVLAAAVALAACAGGGFGTQTTGGGPAGGGQSEQITPPAQVNEQTPPPDETQNDSGELIMLQLTPLKSGEELAVLHTNMGDIKLRFFPGEAPMAVENFITHAKAGYYDGVIFHRVMNEFMIQGGDPEGTGRGGESIWGKGFASEFSLGLRHFRGALSMAHSSLPDSNGSQFFIVQKTAVNPGESADFQQMLDNQDAILAQSEDGAQVLYVRDIFPAECLNEYLQHGGTPFLDLILNEDGHTVFGHVVEGMDVVDAIAALPTNGDDRPLSDVIIESVTFEAAP